jgi:DNA-binding NarL/FixJ family response regulator
MISVVLADDQAVVRMGLRVLVDRERDMQVVGEAGDGREALDRVRETHPDVLLLDIRMPGMDGLETLSAISADGKLADTRVIVVTTFEIDEYVFRALQARLGGPPLARNPTTRNSAISTPTTGAHRHGASPTNRAPATRMIIPGGG